MYSNSAALFKKNCETRFTYSGITSPYVSLSLWSKYTDDIIWYDNLKEKLHKMKCYKNMQSKFGQVRKRATVWMSEIWVCSDV